MSEQIFKKDLYHKKFKSFLLIIFFSFIFIFVARLVQVLAFMPSDINFQGKLTDINGVNVANGYYDFRVKIYDAQTGGSAQIINGSNDYIDIADVNVLNGIFNIKFTPLASALNGSDRYLQVCFNSSMSASADGLTGGADGTATCGSVFDKEFTPRKKLTSNPYSIISRFLGSNIITGTDTGELVIGINNATGTANTTGALRFVSAGDNAFSTLFNVGTQSQNITYTLPTSQATATGQVLTNDGSGNLSWTSASSCSTCFVNAGNSFGSIATLGTNDNFALNFETNNLNRMTLDTNGYLGIGTTSPSEKIEINGGNLKLTYPTSSTARFDPDLILVSRDSSSSINNEQHSTITFKSGPVENNIARIDSDNFAQHLDFNFWDGNISDWKTTARMSLNSMNVVGSFSIYPNPITSGSSLFEVDGVGNLIKVRSVPYSWPSSQGGVNTVLVNNGSGTLSWSSASSLCSTCFINGGNSFGSTANIGTNDNFAFNLKSNNITRMTLETNGTITFRHSSGLGRYFFDMDNGKAIFSLVANSPSSNETFTIASSQNTTSSAFGIMALNVRSELASTTIDASKVEGIYNYLLLGGSNVVTNAYGISSRGSLEGSRSVTYFSNFTSDTISTTNTTATTPIQEYYGFHQIQSSFMNAQKVYGIKIENLSSGTLENWSIYSGTAKSYFGGNIGILDTNPSTALSIGSGGLFQVNSSGNLTKINNVVYSWPTAQGGAGTVLTNNGSGTLTWSSTPACTTCFINNGNSFGANATLGTNDNFSLAFETNNTTQMTIDNTGKVGIGISSPSSKLHVVETASTAERGVMVQQSTNDTNAATLFFRKSRGTALSPTVLSSGDVLGHIGFSGYNGSAFVGGAGTPAVRATATQNFTSTANGAKLDFYTVPNNSSANALRLTIDQNGNLISPPTYNAIVGATNRDLFVDNTGLIGYVSSSIRYKTNVVDMADTSNDIYKLRPVNYETYRDPGILQRGLIAEEVEKVMPELVSYNDKGTPETVNYSRLTPLLLNEVIKQNNRIIALENAAKNTTTTQLTPSPTPTPTPTPQTTTTTTPSYWTLSNNVLSTTYSTTINADITAKNAKLSTLNINSKLSIDANGNIVTVGSIKSDSLITTTLDVSNAVIKNLKVDKLSINNTPTTGDPTVGSATITANTKTITINNSNITVNSKVFVTITSTDTDAFSIKKTVGKGFIVTLKNNNTTDISFDYWIVGE